MCTPAKCVIARCVHTLNPRSLPPNTHSPLLFLMAAVNEESALALSYHDHERQRVRSQTAHASSLGESLCPLLDHALSSILTALCPGRHGQGGCTRISLLERRRVRSQTTHVSSFGECLFLDSHRLLIPRRPVWPPSTTRVHTHTSSYRCTRIRACVISGSVTTPVPSFAAHPSSLTPDSTRHHRFASMTHDVSARTRRRSVSRQPIPQ